MYLYEQPDSVFRAVAQTVKLGSISPTVWYLIISNI